MEKNSEKTKKETEEKKIKQNFDFLNVYLKMKLTQSQRDKNFFI